MGIEELVKEIEQKIRAEIRIDVTKGLVNYIKTQLDQYLARVETQAQSAPPATVPPAPSAPVATPRVSKKNPSVDRSYLGVVLDTIGSCAIRHNVVIELRIRLRALGNMAFGFSAVQAVIGTLYNIDPNGGYAYTTATKYMNYMVKAGLAKRIGYGAYKYISPPEPEVSTPSSSPEVRSEVARRITQDRELLNGMLD